MEKTIERLALYVIQIEKIVINPEQHPETDSSEKV